jgi:transposase
MRGGRNSRTARLTVHDRRRLADALRRVRDVRVYRRVQALLLFAEGRPVDEVTHVTGLSRPGLYRWLKRYQQSRRIEVLRDAPRRGRPRIAAAITAARIARELRRDPVRLGYATTGWTVALLAAHLSHVYGCPISTHTLRRRMHQMRLRWKRPRYVYAEKDPHRAQKKGALFAA